MCIKEIWHRLSYEEAVPGGAVSAVAHIGADSLWFAGHFPDAPVLPGIAVLHMVADVIRHHESERGSKIMLRGIRRVRFKLPVRPGAVLTISLSATDQHNRHAYQFKVTVQGDIACIGIMDVSPLSASATPMA
jgi:3-hydroxyacyl-[acyl-carrier-protein] dehydratase